MADYQRARQTKAIVDQHGLARPISFIHPADLRNGGVRFIDHEQKILREEIDQGVGLEPGGRPLRCRE